MTFVKVRQIAFVVGMVIVASSACAMSSREFFKGMQDASTYKSVAKPTSKIAYKPQQVGAVRRWEMYTQPWVVATGGAAYWMIRNMRKKV